MKNNYYVIKYHVMMKMGTEYSTISIPKDVKKHLEKAKGNKEWGEFILDLYKDAQYQKSKKAFDELANMLKDEDLKTIARSSKEFRANFALR
jgi:predicted CopG family antitoxin